MKSHKPELEETALTMESVIEAGHEEYKMENLTSRQIQAIQSKKKIFEAGIELIAEHGFHNITMSQIAKKAGVSVGAIYHYFESKQDIMYEIYNQFDEHYKTVVEPKIEGMESDEKLITVFKYYAEYNQLRDVQFTSHLYSADNKNFVIRDRYQFSLIDKVIDEGKENKILTKDYDTKYITDYLVSIARGVVFDWCIRDGSYDLTEKMIEIIKLNLKLFRI